MNSIEEKIALLTLRIQEMVKQHDIFKAKLFELTQELELLKAQASRQSIDNSMAALAQKMEIPHPVTASKTEENIVPSPAPAASVKPLLQSGLKQSRNIEEFLGKNLASKIGILITVIGIFIGAKYAIERNMISEQVRIALGYLSGLLLTTLGFRLRKKYPAYSAVLLGGGLCVCYFITYIGFTYYHLFPHLAAFFIMIAVTGAIVYSALLYNRVVIAHLGQVGAYAIPFLLSDNSGNYTALFSYITIINAGMLIVSFKRYWKSLLYAAFGLTWLIFLFWFLVVDDDTGFQQVSWFFMSIFFLLFYTAILIYKLVRKEKFSFGDLLLLIPNAFIFYSLGLHLLGSPDYSGWWKPGFTMLNVVVHSAVAVLVKGNIGKDNNLYSVLVSIVISLLAIAVPVSCNGMAIPMLWAAEAGVLFVLGRSQDNKLYRYFSMALSAAAFLALMIYYLQRLFYFEDHSGLRVVYDAFLNRYFLTSFVVLAISYLLIGIYRSGANAGTGKGLLHVYYNLLLPIITVLVTYIVIFAEITRWFTNINETLAGADGSFGPWSSEVMATRALALLLYSFFFVLILVAINQRWFRSQIIRAVSLAVFIFLSLFWAVLFIRILNIQGINYFEKQGTGLYFGSWNWLQRYCMLLPIAGILYYFQPEFYAKDNRGLIRMFWPQLVILLLLVFLSFEYLFWTKVAGAGRQFTYGLSVLWGLYALLLIAWGIWKKHRAIRLSAMIMLAITLLKLIFVDLSNARTLTRTISYIALGGILLLISYLYNRYKNILFGKDEPEN